MFKKIIDRFFYGPSTSSEDLLKTVSPPYVVQYSIVGLIFGAIFPIVGMVLLAIDAKLPINFATFWQLQQTEPLLWIIDSAPLFLLIYAAFGGLREDQMRNAFRNLVAERENVTELRDLTNRLQRRSTQLHTIAGISEQFSVTQDVNELLTQMLNALQKNFGYYHAHVYLLDKSKKMMVVAEGTGEAGAALKANRHSINLDAETSLVAQAARENKVIWVDNVREDLNWLPNELLPHTFSEMAVPIAVENEIVGVLDVQETKQRTFDEGDAEMLKLMANQVGLSIRDAKLFAEVAQSLSDAQTLQERYQRQAWNRDRILRRSTGRAIFNRPGATSLNDETIAENRLDSADFIEPTRLEKTGEKGADLPYKTAVAPVKVDNVVIGNLQLYRDESQPSWTSTELNFIEVIMEQVAQAAENLRLFDETQERASREQLIAEIGEKMRGAPNIEALMSVTTSELMRVLGGARTLVQLGDGSSPTEKQAPPLSPPPAQANGHVRRHENGRNKE